MQFVANSRSETAKYVPLIWAYSIISFFISWQYHLKLWLDCIPFLLSSKSESKFCTLNSFTYAVQIKCEIFDNLHSTLLDHFYEVCSLYEYGVRGSCFPIFSELYKLYSFRGTYLWTWTNGPEGLIVHWYMDAVTRTCHKDPIMMA